MNDMPMGLAFALAITEEEEAEQTKRERAYDRDQQAKKKNVIYLESRRPSIPPSSRRAA